jgi:dienelactone hydrolase
MNAEAPRSGVRNAEYKQIQRRGAIPPFISALTPLCLGASAFILCLFIAAQVRAGSEKPLPDALAPAFRPPAELANDFGSYRSPLLFNDGTKVQTPADWPRRRKEIFDTWTDIMGAWPPLLEKPALEFLGNDERREGNVLQRRVRVQVAADQSVNGYLLIPDGAAGKLPGVVVVYYEPETSIGRNPDPAKGAFRDYGIQLARRGFVTLSIGSPGGDSRQPPAGAGRPQPLSFLGYVAANCHTVLARQPQVDPNRIGIVGHSYGGKWAMFGACLYEKFAAAAWSDPGVAFDEARPNINYWERWYLGFDPSLPQQRKPGLITPDNPRTGAYKKLVETGHDLHEFQALMAPRPFLVSGGAEDPPARWKALNHARAVNELLGYPSRVGMTNRPKHDPDEESNERVYQFFEHFLKAPPAPAR